MISHPGRKGKLAHTVFTFFVLSLGLGFFFGGVLKYWRVSTGWILTLRNLFLLSIIIKVQIALNIRTGWTAGRRLHVADGFVLDHTGN